ncbi:DNA/RNA helicase domain-containing protein [Priestia megaterium]
MKPVNLLSLVSARKDLKSETFESYINHFGMEKIRDSEMDDLEALINELSKLGADAIDDIFEGFYVGYKINQINKEFDLLRFGDKGSINIEIKRKSTKHKIKEQLIANKYYVSFLDTNFIHFTYVSEDSKLYYLDKNEELTLIDLEILLEALRTQKLKDIDNINQLFNPSNYLVSPFNSTQLFMEGRYFLTEHQQDIKEKIKEVKSSTGPTYITLEGAAGTGKTLLTYDIAKEYINSMKKVLIFHCGSLNTGHTQLIASYSWKIASIKAWESYDFNDYDLIILDETQRIYKYQLDKFLEKTKETNTKIIFSYDPLQCLKQREIDNKIPEYIKLKIAPINYKLTEKIRTNKEIASFIKNLFDLSKRNNSQKYANITIQYLPNASSTKKELAYLKKKGWKIINYTPSRYNIYPYDQFQEWYTSSTHDVVGQEFDNVVAVIDKYFYYDKTGKLSTKGWNRRPLYHPTRMLFQMVTRARKRLHIIIIENEVLLDKCLKIIHNY